MVVSETAVTSILTEVTEWEGIQISVWAIITCYDHEDTL